jgi:hypothetical protein
MGKRPVPRARRRRSVAPGWNPSRGGTGNSPNPPLAVSELVNDDDGLTAADRVFCVAYRANGFKSAASAYRGAYPMASPNTCRVEGPKRLTKPAVKAWIEAAFVQHLVQVVQVQALGAEMLGRTVLDGRADIRDCFDHDGTLLPVSQWPDAIANSVESVDLRADGTYRIRLVNKATARRIVMEATGILKNATREEISTYARLLRADLEDAYRKGLIGPPDQSA